MKKSFRLVISAGAILFLLVTGCATSKKNCHCPSWGKQINKNDGLQKSS
jgi:hypothetical protein